MSESTQKSRQDEPMVPLSELSAALDEIYRLRTVLAQQSLEATGHSRLASLSTKRRAALEESAEVMAMAAQGRSGEVVAGLHTPAQTVLRTVGADPLLTRASFVKEQEHRA